jgi:hypothetical protein
MQMFMSRALHFATLGRDQAQPESLMLIFARTPYTKQSNEEQRMHDFDSRFLE